MGVQDTNGAIVVYGGTFNLMGGSPSNRYDYKPTSLSVKNPSAPIYLDGGTINA